MSKLEELVERAAKYDDVLARDIADYVRGRSYGLVYEASKPEFVRMWNKPVKRGDTVNILPPRGVMEDTKSENDPSEVRYKVLRIQDGTASLRNLETNEMAEASVEDIVPIARFDQPIYAGLKETGRVERGGDKPYHVVVNGENFHALQTLLYAYQGKVDCIYIDPPYNTGAKDWKYNNNYVGAEDVYRHSKWLTFMEDRLKLAKKLLNPKDSVLIVTIDEKEYLRLGLLLEQLFPEAVIQMVTAVINPKGSVKNGLLTRCDEYIFFVMLGNGRVIATDNDMLFPPPKRSAVRWASLKRTGSNSRRAEYQSNAFYPLFYYKDSGRFAYAGESLPAGQSRHEVETPDGLVAVWPIDNNGDERIWQLYPESLNQLAKEGFVSFGRLKNGKATPYYATSGIRAQIESGEISIVGYDADGVAQLEYSSGLKKSPAKTTWNMTSHSASEHGTNLLKSFIPNRRFPYPKSMYAVEDTIRQIVGEKPDALIVDFFGGSGTTAHATMRLNHQDGGRRRCVSITNNEVGADEQKKYTEQGLRQGDPEWEKFGICEYITKPRIEAAITGETPEGNPIKGDYKFVDEFPMADGFKENAIFFNLEYLEPSIVGADLAFDEIAPILWMAGGCAGPILEYCDSYSVGSSYAVLNDPSYMAEFVRKIEEKGGVKIAFIVTDSPERYRSLCAKLANCEVKQLYESYLRSFEINAIG